MSNKSPVIIKRKSPESPVKINIKSGKKAKSTSITEQYVKYYKQAIAKYGKRTAVLLQVGKFFEVYSYDAAEANGEYETNIYEVAEAMNDIQVGVYNTKAPMSLTNAKRCGVQTDMSHKYINCLLDENFTVVLVEQLNDSESGDTIQREVSKVLSPGVSDRPIDFNYNNIVCVVIENQNPRERLLHRIDQYELCIGMASMDVSSNSSTVYEIGSTRKSNPELAINEAYRFLQTHHCRELVVLLEGFDVKNEKEEKKLKRYFEDNLELDRYNIHHYELNSISKEFKKSRYQNKVLQKVFGDSVCGPGVSPIEYLELQMHQNAVLSYCCLIDFVYQRNEQFLKDLQRPEWWENETHLVLTHNAIRQLDITRTIGSNKKGKNSSLFNIINHTVTNQGKRLLESRLLHPFLDEETLKKCYAQIEDLLYVESENIGCLKSNCRNLMRGICDFERFHRKIDLHNIYPDELHVLIQSYNTFIQLIDWFYMICDEYPEKTQNIKYLLPTDGDMKDIRHFSNEFYKVYNYDALKRNGSFKTVQENLFNEGIDDELDEISEHLGNVDERLDKIRLRLCKIVDKSSDKAISLREPKKGGRMFRSSIIHSAVLKWYQKQIRNAIHATGKQEEDAIQHIKVLKYDNTTEFCKYNGNNVNDSDILDFIRKKKIQIVSDNSDEEDDEGTEHCSKNNTKEYLTAKDMSLILSLNFRTNKSNVNITTDVINSEEQVSDEYTKILSSIMYPKSTEFIKKHFEKYSHIIDVFPKLSSMLDLIQSHTTSAIKYQYFKPNVVERKTETNEVLPSFIDLKGFRHPIIERIQTDIEYIKNDIKLGKETEEDDNMLGILLFALNNCGKSSLEKAIALNIVLAQAGSFVPADSMRFRPFKNIITRLDGMDNMFKGQGSFAVEMSELRTVANQSLPNSLVLGDEICKGTEQDSAMSIMASTIEWLCTEKKANFIFSSHYHEILDFDEISGLKELGIYHLKGYPNPKTGEIVYEYKLSKGVGTTIFGIEVARSMGYHPKICDRAIYFRNKRLSKKQHYLDTKTSNYNSGVYMDKCSVEGCKVSPDDTHHEAQQQTADQFGNIGHFHKNRMHNLVPLCKSHHCLADKGKLNFTYKMTSNGVKLMCNVMDTK